MLRIFTQVNYSNPKNPAADSGIQMQACMAKAVVTECDDVFFYIMLPADAAEQWRPAFKHDRIQLLVAPLAPKQSGGLFHFDPALMSRLLDLRRTDIDVLLINQPELTPAFLDYFNKRHFFHVPAISYIHWLDWRRYDAVKNEAGEPSVLAALTGAVLSAKVGCNSAHGRDRILKVAARWFTDEILNELAEKLVLLPPGIDLDDLQANRCSRRDGPIRIIVPHRAQKYTGFKTLIESYLPKVWKLRQDFEVILTNPSHYDFIEAYQEKYPFVRVRRLDRGNYLKALWQADLVIGSHVGCNQWSVATLEAICANCVPLMSAEGFYREMLTPIVQGCEWAEVEDRWFYYRAEFASRLVYLMDNLEQEKKRVALIAKRARQHYNWEGMGRKWVELFYSAVESSPTVRADSVALGRLVREIRKHGTRSKAQLLNTMGWHPKSRHIPWTKYRRRLLSLARESRDSAESVFIAR